MLSLGMQTPSADLLLEYSLSHVKFVHWAARMPNSDKLCNSFRASEANWRLDLSLSLLAAAGSVSWPCRMWPGSKELRLAKESVAPWRRSSADWMPERTRRLSVGVGRRHPVTMRKASLRTLSMRRWGEYARCDTKLEHSTQQLSRIGTRQLYAMSWHQRPILNPQVTSAAKRA